MPYICISINLRENVKEGGRGYNNNMEDGAQTRLLILRLQSFHANPISNALESFFFFERNALESCLVVSSFDKIILATS